MKGRIIEGVGERIANVLCPPCNSYIRMLWCDTTATFERRNSLNSHRPDSDTVSVPPGIGIASPVTFQSAIRVVVHGIENSFEIPEEARRGIRQSGLGELEVDCFPVKNPGDDGKGG